MEIVRFKAIKFRRIQITRKENRSAEINFVSFTICKQRIVLNLFKRPE